MNSISQSEVLISAPAGVMAGALVAPPAPRRTVVLSGATGIPHGYYQHFARWLAEEHGAAVLTYDYTGFGASLDAPMKEVTSSMSQWAVDDQSAARAFLLGLYPELPLTLIGHSLGALGWGFIPPEPQLERAIAICSGPVHQSDHPWPYRATALAFWHLIGPALNAAFGYVPNRFSGLGADIPGPVFRQWRRWCTTRGFFAADPDPRLTRAAPLTCPLRTVGLTDDEMIPAHVVKRLAEWHPEAPHSHHALDPAQHGLAKVGHLAAFRRKNKALWPLLWS